MASGPWGGYSNGRIPLSALVDVVGDGNPSHYLHPAAAYYYKIMQADCLRENGRTFGTEEAYRTYDTQAWYAGPNSPLPKNVARATPGTSKHGWALADDLSNYGPVWNWLMAREGDYGWSWAQGRADGEPWHHTFEGSLDTSQLDWSIFDKKNSVPAQKPQLTQAQDNMLRQVYAAFFQGGSSMPGGRSIVDILQPGAISRTSASTTPNVPVDGTFYFMDEIAHIKTLGLSQEAQLGRITDLVSKIRL